jgi:hypothetical protein
MNTPTLGEPLHVGNYKLADLDLAPIYRQDNRLLLSSP